MRAPTGTKTIAALAGGAVLLSAALYGIVFSSGGGVWWGAKGAALISLIYFLWLITRGSPGTRRRWIFPLLAVLLYLLPIAVAWTFEDEGITRFRERQRKFLWESDQSSLRASLDATADSLLYDYWERGVRTAYPEQFVKIKPVDPWQYWQFLEFYARKRGGDTTELVGISGNPGAGRGRLFVNADGSFGRSQRRLLMTTMEKQHVVDN
jgi:hypothetical protein